MRWWSGKRTCMICKTEIDKGENLCGSEACDEAACANQAMMAFPVPAQESGGSKRLQFRPTAPSTDRDLQRANPA